MEPLNDGHLGTIMLYRGYSLQEVKMSYHAFGPVGTTEFLNREVKCTMSFIWSVL